jgi:hypothetical protein
VKIIGRLRKHNRYGYVDNILFQIPFIKKYRSVKDLYHDYKSREEEEEDGFAFLINEVNPLGKII